jgi:hypothetical protein
MPITKTVHYCFQNQNDVIANTTASFDSLMIYLPETNKSFISTKLGVSTRNKSSIPIGYTKRYTALGLNGGSKVAIQNTQNTGQSGESISLYYTNDYRNLFTASFGANNLSASAQLDTIFTISGSALAGLIPTQSFECSMLSVTYQCNTGSTQIKSVYIPLNAPSGDLSTTKPGTPNDVIPALDTYLPEANKVYRDIFIVVEGNENRASSTDSTLTMQIDSLTPSGSFFFEGALASDTFYQIFWKLSGSITFDTSTTHDFYIWSQSLGRYCHPIVYMVVTYEYDESSTTSVMNSIMLPMELTSTIGLSATDFQKASRTFFIEEPGPITTNRISYMLYMDQQVVQTGLNARIGTGSFVTYTDRANVLCGSNALMIRNDNAYTFSRGRNSLEMNIYSTRGVATSATNPSGYWMINYTSGKSSAGSYAHNSTVIQNIDPFGSVAAATGRLISGVSASLKEPYYYLTAIGNSFYCLSSGLGGVSILPERLASEGGPEWMSSYTDLAKTDTELGIHAMYSTARSVYQRWVGDVASDRVDPKVQRDNAMIASIGNWNNLDFLYTYHSITSSISGSVYNTGGQPVGLEVCRVETDEIILTGSRTGDGPYSFVWYDNTEPIYIRAQIGSNVGYSPQGTASIDTFDVSVGSNYNININLS